MAELITAVIGKYNYWAFLVLLLIGLHAMISKNNLVKKVIGMSIFQSAIILFYVSIGYKKGSTIPIVVHGHGSEQVHQTVAEMVAGFVNPLPHVLMLTAIVVGVSTLGVALALIQKIHRVYGTIEEDEILEKIKE
jgi:multicomponent Na+:H+ antiporter subunit C